MNINKSVETYLNEEYEKFKEYERFQFLIDKINKNFNDSSSLLDIGGAKGELIYLLKQKYPKANYTCLEYNEELIELGRKNLKDVKFIQGDAKNFNLNRKFDVVVMSGVLSIFDEIEVVLNNMLKHIKCKGYGYIFGGFNKEDIDVIVRYKNNYLNSNIWESGWNMFSINSVKKILTPYISDFNVYKFNLTKELAKKDNPVKSYTLKLESGELLILTGGNIIRDFYLLIFQRNEKEI